MKNYLTSVTTIISFLILCLQPVAAAGADRKIEKYLSKTERMLVKSNKKLEKKIMKSTDEELLKEFGDFEFDLVKKTGQFSLELGMSELNSTRENLLLFISQRSVDTQLALAEKKILELGSLKLFKKSLKNAEKKLKRSQNHKGIITIGTYIMYAYVAFVYVGLSIFFLCGEGGCGND